MIRCDRPESIAEPGDHDARTETGAPRCSLRLRCSLSEEPFAAVFLSLFFSLTGAELPAMLKLDVRM